MKKTLLVAVFVILFTQVNHAKAGGAEAILNVAKNLYEIVNQNDLSLDQVRNEILNEIADTRDEILEHMDDILAMDARVCAKMSFIDFESLDDYNDNTAEAAARDMQECTITLHETIAVVEDKAEADKLGRALHIVGPMTKIALEKTGLPDSYIIDEISDAETTIKEVLKPNCYLRSVCESVYGPCEYGWLCTAYNGDRGYGYWRNDKQRAINNALRNTSASISSSSSGQ